MEETVGWYAEIDSPLPSGSTGAISTAQVNWEGEWCPAVIQEVSGDAYDVEWVDEPEVFNRVDATDVSRAVFMTHGGRGWLGAGII